MQIGLVACGAKKVDGPVAAKDLYQGTLFKLSRQYAETTCDRWFILSAKYGLLLPNASVVRYNKTLNEMGVADRMRWATEVLRALEPFDTPDTTWLFLAGVKYREFIIDRLQGPKEIPLVGLGIGKQLAALQALLRPSMANISEATIGGDSGLTFSPKSDIIISSESDTLGSPPAPTNPGRIAMNKALGNAVAKVSAELMTFKDAEEVLGRSAFSLRMKAKKDDSIETIELFGRRLIPVKEVERLQGVFEAAEEARQERIAAKAKAKPEGYPGMSNAELRALCDERGIKKGGTKPVLVERLELYDTDPDAFSTPADSDEDEAPKKPAKPKKAAPKKPRKPSPPKADPPSEPDDEDEEEIPSLDDLLAE